MANFGLVLLAAGSSSRMGEPKQLMDYGGKPLIRHAVDTALASMCQKVLIVLGANSAAVRSALQGADVEIVENPRWAEGMGTSIRAGILAADQSDLDGVVLSLADQPLITPAILNRLVLTHAASRRPIVASQYAGTVGVPAFFSREFFPNLLALEPVQGCKGVILSNAAKVIRLDCPEAELDVDTPEDYLRAQSLSR